MLRRGLEDGGEDDSARYEDDANALAGSFGLFGWLCMSCMNLTMIIHYIEHAIILCIPSY